MLEVIGVSATCGTTTIITFLLLGPISLFAGFVFFYFRKKISRHFFVIIEILLLLVFLMYTIHYKHYKCMPSMGGGQIQKFKYQVFPGSLLPIKIIGW